MDLSTYLKIKRDLFEGLLSESEKLMSALKEGAYDSFSELQEKRHGYIQEIQKLDTEVVDIPGPLPEEIAPDISGLRLIVQRTAALNRRLMDAVSSGLNAVGENRKTTSAARKYARAGSLRP